MERRELLKMIAAITGGVFIGGQMLTGCKSNDAIGGIVFSKEDISFLDEVGDTILPTTKTPGAKSANIGKFMEKMVNDTYDENEKTAFHKGIGTLNEACKKLTGKSFTEATAEQRTSLLVSMDKEAKNYQNTKKEKDAPHYFTMMKQLTLLGYFNSKVGASQALRHVAVPGKYDGAFPYKKGDKTWATN